ncbi:hypothetical protein NKJ84_30355 [Mesorhizobium sp. M0048]|uniref:hypothetical protein n=1 Tax=Mesorhizobium sp. M0048 TaxID=2956860 RepID=UPI00333A0C51
MFVRQLGEGVEYDRAEAAAIFDQAWRESELEEHMFGAAYSGSEQELLKIVRGLYQPKTAMSL